MKKILPLLALSLVVSSPLAADWIVLKDGTRYEISGKPKVEGNKLTFTLKNGQAIQVPADSIDRTRSEEATRFGGGTLLAGQPQLQPISPAPQPSALGARIRLRQQEQAQPQVAPPVAVPPPSSGGLLGTDVVDKFERAYENVGIFEHKMSATAGRTLRADLTTDSEDKVFNAISATAFLIVHNAGLSGVTIDEVDMYMKMTNGGTAGRFHMTRADADALYLGGNAPDHTRLQEYFIHKVLF